MQVIKVHQSLQHRLGHLAHNLDRHGAVVSIDIIKRPARSPSILAAHVSKQYEVVSSCLRYTPCVHVLHDNSDVDVNRKTSIIADDVGR